MNHSESSKTRVKKDLEICKNCMKDLTGSDRALFVEEEVGRVFCSEDCITSYFAPEIERLEKEYFRKLSPIDLSGEERNRLNHLRWTTLQKPDEVWREKTLTGDYRFTLISEFDLEKRKIWCVCICLFLRGEPSFLFLSFQTKNSSMANIYRRGERMQIKKKDRGSEKNPEQEDDFIPQVDGLASAWTEDETIRAELTQERSISDIPANEFGLYQECLDDTLETPDEVWSLRISQSAPHRLYHFIKYYPIEEPGIFARIFEGHGYVYHLGDNPSNPFFNRSWGEVFDNPELLPEGTRNVFVDQSYSSLVDFRAVPAVPV